MNALLRQTLLVLLALFLTACRTTPSPLGPLSPSSASSSSEKSERTDAIELSQGLQGLVWGWESPDGTMPQMPEKSEDYLAEFRRRFAGFCRDTGIVKSAERPITLAGAPGRSVVAELPHGGRAWCRLLELNCAFDGSRTPESIAVDLLVLEVNGDLARNWGLDGMPAGGKPPVPLADGVPTSMTPEAFDGLRSLLLGTPGSRIHAAASTVSCGGAIAIVRQVRELPLRDVSLSGGERPESSVARPGVETTSQKGLREPVPRQTVHVTGELRDVGVVVEATALPAREGTVCTVMLSAQISEVVGEVTYSCGDHSQSPLISSLLLEGETFCRMGRTVLLGTTCRERGRAGRSCYLAFLTTRAFPPLPCWPEPGDYVSPSGQLVMLPLGTFLMPTSSKDTIDWGDDGKDRADRPSSPPSVRSGLESLGVDCGPGTHVLLDARIPVLAYFGTPESVRQVQELWQRTSASPQCTLYRAAAIRVSPELWLELTRSHRDVYGESSALMDRQEVRALLEKVQRDKRSGIVSSGMASGYAGKSTSLRDRVEVPAPEAYVHGLPSEHPEWVPVLGDPRDVGMCLEGESTYSGDLQQVKLQLHLENSELAGWQPLGSTKGFPRCDSSSIETSVSLKPGQYLVLAGGGRDSSANPFVIWLIGAERVGW